MDKSDCAFTMMVTLFGIVFVIVMQLILKGG